jgi:hypothetical protein
MALIFPKTLAAASPISQGASPLAHYPSKHGILVFFCLGLSVVGKTGDVCPSRVTSVGAVAYHGLAVIVVFVEADPASYIDGRSRVAFGGD